MNLKVYKSGGNALTDCEIVKGFAFNTTAAWDSCALLPVLAADFGLAQDNCAHFAVLNASRVPPRKR